MTAAADGRVTLSRMERLLDEGPNRRWKATWPPDADDLLARREAAIEQRHHPAVILEGSGTFVADSADSLHLPDASVPADVLRADFLPGRSARWFAVVDSRGRVAWTHKGDAETSLLIIASYSTPLPYLAYLRNGALLRAGLVDELHVITVPALIGGLGTPSVMDGPPLGPGSSPERLRTLDVQVGTHGTIWAHYEVVARGSAP